MCSAYLHAICYLIISLLLSTDRYSFAYFYQSLNTKGKRGRGGDFKIEYWNYLERGSGSSNFQPAKDHTKIEKLWMIGLKKR